MVAAGPVPHGPPPQSSGTGLRLVVCNDEEETLPLFYIGLVFDYLLAGWLPFTGRAGKVAVGALWSTHHQLRPRTEHYTLSGTHIVSN